MIITDRHKPIGSVDTDTDPRYLAATQLVNSRNMVHGDYIGYGGARVPYPRLSAALSNPTLHASAKCIGAVAEESLNIVIYAIYSPDNNHSIWRYDMRQQSHSKLIYGSFLNFSPEWYVQFVICDKHLVTFTDGTTSGSSIVGNPPRMFNLDRADNTGKNLTYELLVGDTFVNGTRYRIDFFDINFAPTGTFSEFVVTGVAGDKPAGLQLLTDWLNTLATPEQVVATTDGKSIMMSVSPVGTRARVTSNFSATPAENAFDVYTVPINHYVFENIFPVPGQDPVLTDEYFEFQIAREKYQPRFRPEVEYATDAAYTSNFVNRIMAQFTWRYVYDNGEKSKWGAYSRVTLPSADTQNYIDIIFDDTWLRSSVALGMIKNVQFAVRYGNDEPFRLFKTLERGDIGFYSTIRLAFYNDSEYPAVPSDEDGDPDLQLFGLFDYVPDISGTVELVADEDGSSRIVDGAVKFGFDPVKVDVGFEAIDADVSTYGYNIYKHCSRYQFGIVYAKRGGKRSGVNPCDVFSMPDWTDDDYLPLTIQMTIRHLPPPDATHYYIVRKKNLLYQRWKPLYNDVYFGEAGPKIEYGRLAANEAAFTTEPFGTAGNTHVRFRCIAPWTLGDPTNYVVDIFDNTNAEWFFAPEKGDRFRLILNYAAVLTGSTGFNDDYELEAVEYGTAMTGGTEVHEAHHVWLYAKITPSTPDYSTALDNFIIELYTPRRADDGIYYEIEGGTITDGFHDKAGVSVGGGQQPQTASQPAIINLYATGDAYWRPNMLPDYPGRLAPTTDSLEVESAYLFIESKNDSIGKPNAEDPTQKSMLHAGMFFISDIYLPGSSTNGLSNIRSLNYKQLNSSYGTIKRLMMSGGVLLAICENKVQPIYVGKNRMLDLSGGQSIGRSDQLFSLAEELSDEAGTRHPMSAFRAFGNAYFYDAFRGRWWRYNNGLYPITDYGMSQYFRSNAVSFGVLAPEENWFIGGYDPRMKMPLVKIWRQSDGIFGEMWGFREEQGQEGFVGQFDFLPEMMVTCGPRLISFLNGKIWHHDNNPVGCNFYNTQYTPTFTIAANGIPEEIKLFQGLRITCPQQKLILPNNNSILIPATKLAVFGMASRLKAGKFVNYEGKWWADLMRDLTDTASRFTSIGNLAIREATALNEGRFLRGEYMLLKFQPETASLFFSVFEVDIDMVPSNPVKS